MTSKTLEPVLLANLTRAIDFVKFGEAKNAALLTFASAWILASASTVLNPVARAVPQILWGVIWGAPCLGAAAFLAGLSFLPRDSLKGFKDSDADAANLLFFGDLAGLKPREGYRRIAERYHGEGDTLSDAYLCDLGCQIVVNSQVARWKFGLFRRGVRALLLGLSIYAANAVLVVVDRMF